MENNNDFPCLGCDERSSCTGACGLLHKFLRNDPECHQRFQSTERVLSPELVIAIADKQQANPTRLTWAELADSTLEYWDIMNNESIDEREKEIFLAFYVEGMPYKAIARRYKITTGTVYRLLHSGRVRARNREME